MSHQKTNTYPEATTQLFPPLELERRPTVTTAAAAYYLNRKPQTLRCWATYQNGPVNPIRIFGRLAWNTADLRRLLGVEWWCLNRRISERELDRMTADMPQGLAALRREFEAQNAAYPAPVRVFLGGELRLVRTVENVVLPFMLERVKP